LPKPRPKDRRFGNHIDKKLSGCDAQFVEQTLHVDANGFVVLIDTAPGFRLPAELEFAAARQQWLEHFISKHGYGGDCPKTLGSSTITMTGAFEQVLRIRIGRISCLFASRSSRDDVVKTSDNLSLCKLKARPLATPAILP
jgi:hypothetical protein